MIARMKHIGLVFKEKYLEDMIIALHKLGIFHINKISELKKYSEIAIEHPSNIETEGMIEDISSKMEELRKKYEGFYKGEKKEQEIKPIELKDIESEIRGFEEEFDMIKEDKKKLIANSTKTIDRLVQLEKALDIIKARTSLKRKLGRIEGLIIIDGWIPKKEIGSLEKTIKTITKDYYIEITDPEKEDDVPVKLENNRLTEPFEILTKLYSAPLYKDIDPTPIIAITFPLIFGIMTADLIDGLVLLMFSIFVVEYSYKKKNWTIAQIGKIGIFLGISSMIFGLLFGEALGDLIKIKATFNPFTHISQFMIIVLALGIGHITLGILIGIIQDIRKKEIRNLIFKFSYLIIIASVILLLLSMHTHQAWWALGIGFVLLIVGKGFTGLLETPRLLSNTISYGRILAINMAHLGIAKAFSLLGTQVAKGVIGTIFAIIFVMTGHLVLLTLGTIIAFIHTLRLHFVEFFSKFKEEYGIWYEPFSIETI